jgi:prepilin-type processing-associated H-X9-DG protein
MNYLMSDSPLNQVSGYKAPRVGSIRNAAEKILLVEEDPLTVTDGAWTPPAIDYSDSTQNLDGADLLATRHDAKKGRPDAGWSMPDIPNLELRGNVTFVDGHAEFQSRRYAHDRAHVDPNYAY